MNSAGAFCSARRNKRHRKGVTRGGHSLSVKEGYSFDQIGRLRYSIAMVEVLGSSFWSALGTDRRRMPSSYLAEMSSAGTSSPM